MIEEIYNYFPRGVNPYDAAFDESAETRLKIETIRTRKRSIQHKWDEFIHLVEAEFKLVIDDSPQFETCFANYLSFCLKVNESDTAKFHILLSTLLPVHTIVISIIGKYPPFTTVEYTDIPTIPSLTQSTKDRMQDIASRYSTELNKRFSSNYASMKTLEQIEIPGVRLQNTMPKFANGFQCLFVDHLNIF